MRADGSGDRVLATGARNTAPSWSPDGSRIVFSSMRDGNWELYVVNGDGSSLRRLTTTPNRREDEPSWSPDGTRIAFAAGTDHVPRDIYVVDADGERERQVTRLGRSVWHPRWSPDGARIAFFEFPFPSATIFLVNADGSGLTPLFGRLAFAGFTVGRPIAGRRLEAVLRVTGAGAEVVVTCRATRLRLVAKTFSAGRARCTWAVPPSAKGTRVVGSIAAAERGSRVARTFAFRAG
jgi:dipeptidyl aminopeptidase/acylaminoacyl peptidase